MLKTIKDNLGYIYIKLFKSKTSFSKILFILILILPIVLESGSRFLTELDNERYKIIILVLLVFSSLVLYLARHNLLKSAKRNLHNIKSKKIHFSFSWLFLFFFIFVVLLSLLFCSDKTTNLFSYLYFLAVFISSFLLCKSTSFKEFGSFFVKTLSVISIISLVFFLLLYNTNFAYGTSINVGERYITQSYLDLFYDYGNGLPGRLAASAADRNMSIFWEPGVFGTLLLIGLIFELYFLKEQKSYLRCILFIICILTTFSTAAYLLLPFILFFSLFELPSSKFKSMLIGCGFALGVVFLLISTWYYRDKIFNGSYSLVTRFSSIQYHLKIMFTSPLFGVGPVTANNMYYEISAGTVDAATSTMGYLLSGFGCLFFIFLLIVFISPLFRKDLKWTSKIFIIFFIFFILEKENQVNDFISLTFILMFTFDSLRFKWEPADCYKTNYQNSTIGTIFSKNGSQISKNVSKSFVVKILALAIGLFTIPVYSLYFGNDTYYGVWLTIISILSFITIFDFGFSNGLRTKLSAALQKKDYKLAKEYISSTYTFAATVSGIILIVLTILAFSLNWNDDIYKIGTDVISRIDLSVTIFIVFVTISFQFVLRTVSPILDSLGESALSGSLTLISNVILLVFAIVGSLFNFGNKFIILACLYFVAILTPLVLATFYVFNYRLTNCRPNFKRGQTHWTTIKSLMGLNIAFFVVQLSNLFLLGMNDYIITFVFGDTALVTEYVYYYKIFNFITSAFASIFQPPIWVAVSKAYANNDTEKIQSLRKLTTMISTLVCVLIIGVSISLPFIFEIWLGANAPEISWYIVIIFAVNDLITTILLSQQIIANGMGLVKYQAIIFGIAAACKIPLVLLYNYLFGSVLSFSVVILSNFSITWLLLIILPIGLNKSIKRMNVNDISFNCEFKEVRLR